MPSSCTACPHTADTRSPTTSSTAPAARCGTRRRTGCTPRRHCWCGCWRDHDFAKTSANRSRAIMTSASTRAGRQARIVTLLSSKSVSSQSELATMLAEEGIEVTQATLSRDLEELGAVKLRGADGGVGVYVVPED